MADYKMKAWRGVNVYEGYAVIVFAKTRGKAKVAVMQSDGFEDTDFVDIVVYREPKADKVYDERKELDWDNTIDRIFMVRELGFYCSDDVFDFEDCKECAARYYCDKYNSYSGVEIIVNSADSERIRQAILGTIGVKMIQEYNRCLRCGRRLKTQKNRERGYGDICWKKVRVMQKGRLFEVAKSET